MTNKNLQLALLSENIEDVRAAAVCLTAENYVLKAVCKEKASVIAKQKENLIRQEGEILGWEKAFAIMAYRRKESEDD